MGLSGEDTATSEGHVAELLEYAASDDVSHFILTANHDPAAVHAVGFWYARCPVSARMGLILRTPLMVAAAYGSLEVLQFILSVAVAVEINLHCGADASTALHCAASGAAANAHLAVDLLLNAGADLNAIDSVGRRPFELIPTASILSSLRSSLEGLLGIVSPPLSPTSSSSSSHSSSPSPSSSSSSPVKEEKQKNYPIDPSIHDIQSSIYSSDEFRMFFFKIKPCSRAYSHDWTECPFLHPGENARRRDPCRFQYNCTPCVEFRRGRCPKGDLCEYAHGVFECWLHPAQYRTRLCKDGDSCSRRVCFFAHSTNDLRSLKMPIPCLLANVEVKSPFVSSSPAENCTSLRFKPDFNTPSLSPAIKNHHHHYKQHEQQSILSPISVNSLHYLSSPLGMAPRIMDGVMARPPFSSRRTSFSTEGEKPKLQVQKQQMSRTFAQNLPRVQVGEEPDLSWIQTLVGNSEVGNSGCLIAEKAPPAAIDEEHTILQDWLEQLGLDS